MESKFHAKLVLGWTQCRRQQAIAHNSISHHTILPHQYNQKPILKIRDRIMQVNLLFWILTSLVAIYGVSEHILDMLTLG